MRLKNEWNGRACLLTEKHLKIQFYFLVVRDEIIPINIISIPTNIVITISFFKKNRLVDIYIEGNYVRFLEYN